MPTVVTEGAASAKGFGYSNAPAPVYIEDVFSTYLYTGNGSTQTITNGIDLAGKGGLVWVKNRSASSDHRLFDTNNGAGTSLISNGTFILQTSSQTSFTSSGFGVGSLNDFNLNGNNFASWTFRKQPKFFDVVTYTGNGANRTIAHNLGSVPGCIIVKRTDVAADWQVYHRSLANTEYLVLNSTAAKATGATRWNSTTPTSTVFSLGTDTTVNANTGTYVAYLFAHDAGGFGLTGTDNVISCGTFTTDGSGNATVSLGYEPQWVLVKITNAVDSWYLIDSMRGWTNGGNDAYLTPNTSGSESSLNIGHPFATGFTIQGISASSNPYIYIAIRRGPMKTPTDATKVFSPIATTAATGTKLTTSFPVDLQIFSLRTGTTNKGQTVDRLRGVSTNATESGAQLITNSTAAETTTSIPTLFWDNTGFQMPSSYGGTSEIFWNFRRAPGFFDVVCYTGTGANRTVSHNLGVVPQIILIKTRSTGGGNYRWHVYNATIGIGNWLSIDGTEGSQVDTSNAAWNNTSPTSSLFSLGTKIAVNESSATYVAYLFASCPGVSKVGSYTGNGTSQTINCGFTAGARFVLIKRTDSTGDWYVWDSARGIVAANDPHLSLNTTAAEVTTDDSIDPDNSGFIVNQLAATNINVNTATYIYFAVS